MAGFLLDKKLNLAFCQWVLGTMNFKVEMATGGTAGGAHNRDLLTFGYVLACSNQKTAGMGIKRFRTIGMKYF